MTSAAADQIATVLPRGAGLRPMEKSACPFRRGDTLCTILHCDVTLAKQRHPYSEVIDGSLVLDTIVHQAAWNPVPTGWGVLIRGRCANGFYVTSIGVGLIPARA